MDNTVLLDIWWNVLIKFSIVSKSVILRKSCKNNAKVNSRPWLKIRDGVFSASLPGLQGNPESCQTSKTELFAKIVRNEKPFNIFVKTFILDV